MARWSVTYKDAKGKTASTIVILNRDFQKTRDVVEALESGDLEEAYFAPGCIVSVVKVD